MDTLNLPRLDKDLAEATPPEIDTVLAALWLARYRPAQIVETYHKKLRRDPNYGGERAEQRAAEAQRQVDEVDAAIAPLDAEYRARGCWTRAFLVQSHDGHVHRSMQCSTCRFTTQFVWLPSESGKDESEIIAAAGEKACTVCYPNAPVETRRRPCLYEDPEAVAKRNKRELEQADRRAAAAAKSITNPDGTPLLDDILGHPIKTERTAQIEYVNAAAEAQAWADQWATSHPRAGEFAAQHKAYAERLLAALAHKRRPDDENRVEAEREALASKVTAKLRQITKPG